MPDLRIGHILLVTTLLMWGSLPLQLKILIAHVDPLTLTWYRFTGAALFLLAVGWRSCLRDFRSVSAASVWLLLLLGGVGLTSNYLLYLHGLDHLSPSTAQIIMQTVPFMVLGGGILIFGEPFARRQWWGVLLLVVGSVLFFNQKIDLIAWGSGMVTGIGLILASAVAWTVFLLSQKALLGSLRSRTIMLACYVTGAIALAPKASIPTILGLSTPLVLLVLSATLLAVLSYLAFSTAMRTVPATTAGLTIANIPLVTLGFMAIFAGWVDGLAPENLNATALVGALLVVVGSAFGAVGPRTESVPLPPD